LDWLFANPFVTAKSIAQACRTGVPAAQNNIDRLRGEGILTEITGKRRGRIYCAEELLRTLEEPPPEEPENHST
jgi:ribosomal protein S25